MSALFGIFQKNKKEEEGKGSYHPPLMMNTKQDIGIDQDNAIVSKPKENNANIHKNINTDLFNELNTIANQPIITNTIDLNTNQYQQQQENITINNNNNNGDHINSLKMVNDKLQDIEIPLSEDAKILTSIISSQLNTSSPQQINQLEKLEEPKNDQKKKASTLTESISQSLFRDLNHIYLRLKFVMSPFNANQNRSKALIQWDLWGPFLLTLLLASSLSFQSLNSVNMFTVTFGIIWVGSAVVFINANLLGSNISVFQICSLIGYCLLPFNIISIIFMLTNMLEILRILFVCCAYSWSTYCVIGFMKNCISEDKRGLCLYPIALLNLFLAGVILMAR